MIRNTLLLIGLLCTFVSTASAQNYYPVDVGNIWILESQDGTERITYTIGTTGERFNGEQARILEITTAVLGTNTADVSIFFMQVGGEGIKIHKLVTVFGDIFGTATLEFSPPATLFPAKLGLTETWEFQGETEVDLIGATTVSSVSKVVAIEDVDTPAGTFENCVKIEIRAKTVAALGIARSTSYQWLAPNLGPVKFKTDQDIVFELVKSNLIASALSYDVNADGVVNVLDLTLVAASFGQTDPKADVNADGTVNILDLTLVAQNFGG